MTMFRSLCIAILFVAGLAGWANADSYTATGDYFEKGESPREGTLSPPIEESNLGVHEGSPQLTVNFNGWGLSPPEYLSWEISIELINDYIEWDELSPQYTGHGIPDVLHTFNDPGTYKVDLIYYNESSEPVARYHARYRISTRQQLFNWDDERWDAEFNDSEWNSIYYGESWGGGAAFEPVYFTSEAKTHKTEAAALQPGLEITVTGDGPWEVTCSAGPSSPAGEIVRYEWDLDHDGTFNLDSGRNPVLTRTLKLPGKYIFSLRITDWQGSSATADIEFVVPVE